VSTFSMQTLDVGGAASQSRD